MEAEAATINPAPYVTYSHSADGYAFTSSPTQNVKFFTMGWYPQVDDELSQSFADYENRIIESFNSPYLTVNLFEDDLKGKIEAERVNREIIDLTEQILSLTQNSQASKYISERQQDSSLSRIISVISKLPALSRSIELTADNSIYFTLNFSKKNLFIEFFLEKDDAEPDFVFLVFDGNSCISTGKGSINVIANKLLRSTWV